MNAETYKKRDLSDFDDMKLINGACPNGEMNAPMAAFVESALVPSPSTLNTMNAADLRAVQIAHAAAVEASGIPLAVIVDHAWDELWHEYRAVAS